LDDTLIEERPFASIERAADALAADLAGILKEAIVLRGRATLVVSGGRTPPHVFRRLRQRDIDWERVTVTLSDERWVPVDHPDSNEGLVRSTLLTGVAAVASFVPLYGGEDTPEAGQSACEARLEGIPRPFDAVYLGLGGDGHFASLFPGHPALDACEGICAAVAGSDAREPRLTLTASTILDARGLYLLFSGAEKHAIYAKARGTGPVREIPLRLILLQSRTPVRVLTAP
jgi:6-phosphogluconolactonase